MIKKIKDLTEADKLQYLESVKESYSKNYNVPWSFIEERIRDEIDRTFDDTEFSKMEPDLAIDAAYARKEFGKHKPDIVEYLLWIGKFVSHSDEVEIPD